MQFRKPAFMEIQIYSIMYLHKSQLKIYVFKDLQHYAITALCIYNNLELQKWERSSQ